MFLNTQKKTYLPSVLLSMLWVNLVVRLEKYAALSLNTKKPNWHAFQRQPYANSVLQALSLSTEIDTGLSLPQQSHFADWFCLLFRFSPRFYGHVRVYNFSILKFATCNTDFSPGHWDLDECFCGKWLPDLLQAVCVPQSTKPGWRDLEQKTESWTSWCVLATFLQIFPAHFHCKISCRCEPRDCGGTEMRLFLVQLNHKCQQLSWALV